MDEQKIGTSCSCDDYVLEKGDTLYAYFSDEYGMRFDYIEGIKYCPVCGKELPEAKVRTRNA